MFLAVAGILTLLNPVQDSTVVTDTVAIVQQRLDFATTGRFTLHLNSTETEGNSAAKLLVDNGIFLRQYGVNGLAGISRRGADPQQVQVLWNGLPVANPMPGMTDLNTFNFTSSASLDFIDGGNATMFGSGNAGGTLLLQNNAPQNQGINTSLIYNVGSFGNTHGCIDVGYRKNKKYIQWLTYLGNNKNEFLYKDLVNNEWVTRKMLNSTAEFFTQRLVAGTSLKKSQLSFVAEHSRASRELGRIIGSDKNQGKQWDRSLRAVLAFNTHKQKWNNGSRIGLTQDFIRFADPLIAADDSSKATTLHAQTEFYRQIQYFKFLFGADMQQIFATTEAYSNTKKRFYPGQFVAVTFNKNRTSLTASSRFEWVEKIPVFAIAGEYKMARFYILHANANTNFRRPTLNDLYWGRDGNKALQPEKGMGAELGITRKKSSNAFEHTLRIAGFYRELNNPIVWQPTGSNWQAVNMYFSKFTGIDFSANLKIKYRTNIFKIVANGEYVNSAVILHNGEAARQRIFIPKYNGMALLAWNRKNMLIWVNTIITGSRFTTNDNSESIQGYTIFNTAAEYSMKVVKKIKISLELSANNITGATYQNMPGKPMPMRGIAFTIKIKNIL